MFDTILIFDNYVQDRRLLDNVRDALDASGSLFQDFYWCDARPGTSDDPILTLVDCIWRRNPPVEIGDAAGVEFWLRQCSPSDLGDCLGLHIDKDEALRQLTGSIKGPRLGSVFYPGENHVCGGLLVIEDPDGREITIPPRFNRLVVFDPGRRHHRVTHVESGPRISLAMNIWDDPPVGLETGAVVEVEARGQ